MDGKECKFCGQKNSQTKRVSCIWTEMPQVQKEESLGKLLYDRESTQSISQV